MIGQCEEWQENWDDEENHIRWENWMTWDDYLWAVVWECQKDE